MGASPLALLMPRGARIRTAPKAPFSHHLLCVRLCGAGHRQELLSIILELHEGQEPIHGPSHQAGSWGGTSCHAGAQAPRGVDAEEGAGGERAEMLKLRQMQELAWGRAWSLTAPLSRLGLGSSRRCVPRQRERAASGLGINIVMKKLESD